jgi:hypothetical protein
MKNSRDTIGNWTRNLTAYSAVPQTTAAPRALHKVAVVLKLVKKLYLKWWSYNIIPNGILMIAHFFEIFCFHLICFIQSPRCVLVQYTVYSIPYTVYSIPCLYSIPSLYSIPCLYSIPYTVYSIPPDHLFFFLTFAYFLTLLLPSCSLKILAKAWTGSEGSRRLRFPDFKTVGTWRW